MKIILLIAILIDMISEFFVRSEDLESIRNKLWKKSKFIYRFFFCKFCICYKLAFISCLIWDINLIPIAYSFNYKTVLDYFITSFILTWIVFILDFFYQKAYKSMIERMQKEKEFYG